MNQRIDVNEACSELDRPYEFAKLCSLLANGNRARLAFEIVDRERTVGDLARLAGLSHSATSQHLKILRAASAIKVRKDGLNVYCTISSEPFKSLIKYALNEPA
ncbi:ArsR/SmtB family transcription factor (plasmid) [Brucella pituitosa]|uniref:ArsR/SmtB family transcription factor n=1 Tax=Brucella pituitosa TaxID=571256 RepID=UPI003C76539D